MNRNEKFLDDDGCEINWGTDFKSAPAGITLSDKKIPVDVNNDFITDYYKADIVSVQDYYPFGMLQPGRNFSTSKYTFGFNGQLKTDEISGSGNHYTATFWEYDARLGRRWNTDPVVKPWESPYATFANNPIRFIDPSGADTSFADNTARKDFKTAYNNVQNKITSLHNKINNFKNQLRQGGLRKHQIKKINKNIDNLQGFLSSWKKLATDFKTIINSPVNFHYSSDMSSFAAEVNGNTVAKGDELFFKDKNHTQITGGNVSINIRPGHGEAVIHENRHGVQKLKHGDWPKLKRETNAYIYQRVYDAQSVRTFRHYEYLQQYGQFDKSIRPSFYKYSLEDAIRKYYQIPSQKGN